MTGFRDYLDENGRPRVSSDRPVPPEWRSPRTQAAAARGETPHNPERSPEVPAHDEAATPAQTPAAPPNGEVPGPASRAPRTPLTRAERDANGRFRSAGSPAEQVAALRAATGAPTPMTDTGSIDLAAVARELGAATNRDAQATTRAVTRIVLTLAVLALIGWLAFLAAYGHLGHLG